MKNMTIMSSGLKNGVSAAVKLLFPASIYCIACGNLIDSSRSYAICDRCMREIAWEFGALPAGHAYAHGYYCAAYGGWTKTMVRDMKYHDKSYAAKNIAEIMADRGAGEKNIAGADLIIPVPMHPEKKKKRGYNQAELIAIHLGKLLGIECVRDVLRKTISTQSLTTKSRDERMLSLTNAFSVEDAAPLAGKSILLIDDIFTTGATADACIAALREAEAEQTNLYVFAT